MQVVGYDSGVGDLEYDPESGLSGDREPPELLVADEGAVRSISLEPGGELAYRLGRRHCAGTLDGGGHEPCDDPEAPYCEVHTDVWPCARCVGNCNLPIPACREEHAVYLAAFPPAVFKVGVTRIWRLHARLREQGAVRAAHIHTVSNGRIARSIEAEIAADVGDRVPVAAKVEGLHRDLDEVEWDRLVSEYDVIDRFDLPDEIALAGRPVAETLATGTVLGTRGRILVLEHNGSIYAVDLRDLVGYEISEGAPDRDLQSSLGAFG